MAAINRTDSVVTVDVEDSLRKVIREELETYHRGLVTMFADMHAQQEDRFVKLDAYGHHDVHHDSQIHGDHTLVTAPQQVRATPKSRGSTAQSTPRGSVQNARASQAHRNDRTSRAFQEQVESHILDSEDLNIVQKKVRGLYACCDSMNEPFRNSWLANVVESKCFECFAGCVIAANSAFDFVEANVSSEYATDPNNDLVRQLSSWELLFTTYYVLELLLRMKVHGLYFFVNKEKYWNNFDLIVILVTVVTVITDLAAVSSSVNLGFLRSLRFLKLTRTLRLVRIMRFLSELRIIMKSVLGSAKTLFWCAALLAFTFYVFSMITIQGVTSYVSDNYGTSSLPDEKYAALMGSFGTVQRSMLTYLSVTTGGTLWEEVFDLVMETGEFNAFIFILGVTVVKFAILNVITGIFVENAMKSAAPERQAHEMEDRLKRLGEKQEIVDVCQEITQKETMNQIDFAGIMKEPLVKNFLQSLGIDAKEAYTFFYELCKALESDQVKIASFVEGCMRMKGPATALEVEKLSFETKLIADRMLELHAENLQRMDRHLRMEVLWSET